MPQQRTKLTEGASGAAVPSPAADALTKATRDRRRPRWLYGEGSEPDYRFTFANERTFLAWIRTALAVLAGGIAVATLDLPLPAEVQHFLARLLVSAALACAALAWPRWAQAERAMRRGRPLPAPSSFTALLAVATVVATALLLSVA